MNTANTTLDQVSQFSGSKSASKLYDRRKLIQEKHSKNAHQEQANKMSPIKPTTALADWSKLGTVLSSHTFRSVNKEGSPTMLLITLLVDEEGQLIEFKTRSIKKVFTVFRKFKQNQQVAVEGSGPFREPKQQFSLAAGEVYGSWYMTRLNDTECRQPNKYLFCLTNIQRFRESARKPATIAGTFVDLVEGPIKRGPNGQFLAKGYYVKLMDDAKNLFQILVWRTRGLEWKSFPLDSCNHTSVVLVPFAREQEERYRKKWNPYILTSTYAPVVDSQCIQPKLVHKLVSARQNASPGEAKLYCPPFLED